MRTASLVFFSLLAAAALRFPLAFVDFYNHPDEVWQYIEPAYGMVTGHAVVTWEYRIGIRSWLIPTLFTLPIAIGKAAVPQTIFHVGLARLFASALSLAVVAFGMLMAVRISKLHALLVAFVLATSVQLLYFSGRTSSDGLALPSFFAAAWLLTGTKRDAAAFRLGGLMLGLCLVTRFQLLPALATMAIGYCALNWRAYPQLVLGGVIGLSVDVAVNLLHGQPPLGWMLRNFQANLVENQSAHYGVEPPFWYLTQYWDQWGILLLPLAVVSALGAKRYPVLFGVAVVNVVAHSLVPHKELRFVLLSNAILLFLAALGTGDVVQWAGRRWRRPAEATIAAAVAWTALSAAAVFDDDRSARWPTNKTSTALFATLRSVPNACGIAYYRPVTSLLSQAYDNRGLPMLFFIGPNARTDLRRRVNRFNILIAPVQERPAGFRSLRCLDYLTAGRQDCVLVRAGSCTPTGPGDARFDINAVLAQQKR